MLSPYAPVWTGNEPTYTAAIAVTRDVVAGERCDVSVVANDADGAMTDRIELPAVELATLAGGDLTGVDAEADRVLAAYGWTRTGEWSPADTALYAPVARVTRSTRERIARIEGTDIYVSFDIRFDQVLIQRGEHLSDDRGEALLMTHEEWSQLVEQARRLRARAALG